MVPSSIVSHMRRILLLLVLLFATLVSAQNTPDWYKSLSALNLTGDWVGDGSGEPGKGSGAFSFKLDLDGHVLVRNSFAEYPATADRPAFRHDDLMITYPEGDKLKAVYFDSEGHVIHYDVTTGPDSVVFLSEGPGPGFRLTYHMLDKNRVAIKFEIAPPDKPGQFKTYIEATARRK